MTNFYCQTLEESIGQPKIMSSLKAENPADDFTLSVTDGDEIAFQNIWNRFHLPIKKFIFDMSGNYELTEELAQETFIRVFKGLSKYRKETKFSSWIFGVAKNVVLENSRQLKMNRRNVDIQQAESFAVPEEKSSPEKLLIEAENFSPFTKNSIRSNRNRE